MARRKRVYSRKRRINYRRLALLIGVVVVLILLISMIFKKNSYVDKIAEALNSDMKHMTLTISSVSRVDADVYENNGIRYTNQHEGIRRILSLDESLPESSNEINDIRALLENLVEAGQSQGSKTEKLDQLPAKDDGYYWIETDIIAEDKFLIFAREVEYNFDLYYDIEDKTLYVKEKYFDEFSKKYNKTSFRGYRIPEYRLDYEE